MLARTAEQEAGFGDLACDMHPATPALIDTARVLEAALKDLLAPLQKLRQQLLDALEQNAEDP